MKRFIHCFYVALFLLSGAFAPGCAQAQSFDGQYFSGQGDMEYLELLDIARRMFEPDPEFQNMSMMYTPSWNGLVEGPTWDAWWVQNSYGTTYCSLPFLQEPFITFLQNSQDLWFNQMGDGKTVRPHRDFKWIPPDGSLCDAARPTDFIAKQGDGRTDIHDWGMEFTAAGLLMQAELLLVSRDKEAITHYLPKLERCANFIETRRDDSNNLFLAGPASNLLAPSYAGYKKEDGTYGKAYLAGLSITTIAALDRLIELEKMMGRSDKTKLYSKRRELAKQGLPALTTKEGYFVKSIDPNGTRHGVYGADKHGYFEASPNHDAIAFRVVDDAQAEKIYQKIKSIPGLRPHDFIIANCPGLDDMYLDPTGNWLWSFGTWVNGGHWSTCEARMMMGYSRLGKYEDNRRSMKHLLTFARQFRMDNPLVDFGAKVYQPKEPINLCYDSFGPPASMIRGLFEYIYSAEGLKLIPHIPGAIKQFCQKFPIRTGNKQVYLSTSGSGNIAKVTINGKPWKNFDANSVMLPYESIPVRSDIHISMGDNVGDFPKTKVKKSNLSHSNLSANGQKLRKMYRALKKNKLGKSYEATHCRLGIKCFNVITERSKLNLAPLPEESQKAADQSYHDTAQRVYSGFVKLMDEYGASKDMEKQKIHRLWIDSIK
jgi:hypothetical protein